MFAHVFFSTAYKVFLMLVYHHQNAAAAATAPRSKSAAPRTCCRRHLHSTLYCQLSRNCRHQARQHIVIALAQHGESDADNAVDSDGGGAQTPPSGLQLAQPKLNDGVNWWVVVRLLLAVTAYWGISITYNQAQHRLHIVAHSQLAAAACSSSQRAAAHQPACQPACITRASRMKHTAVLLLYRYCYTALGLLFLTDFTPVGQWLLSGAGASAAMRLAVLQWVAFVVPSLVWVKQSGWDLRTTFKLLPASPRNYLIGLAAGPALWLLINLAIAVKTGNMQSFLSAASTTTSSSSSIGGGSSPGLLLMGAGSGGASAGGPLQQALLLLLAAAASPAVAEELLFRGLLLTALQERLGRTDALAVAAALFALIHLEPQQFFLYCVLGGAAGAAAVASGSVGPAIALHFSFNAAAVAAGLLLQQGGG